MSADFQSIECLEKIEITGAFISCIQIFSSLYSRLKPQCWPNLLSFLFSQHALPQCWLKAPDYYIFSTCSGRSANMSLVGVTPFSHFLLEMKVSGLNFRFIFLISLFSEEMFHMYWICWIFKFMNIFFLGKVSWLPICFKKQVLCEVFKSDSPLEH